MNVLVIALEIAGVLIVIAATIAVLAKIVGPPGPFVYGLLRDRKKDDQEQSDMEEALIKEFREVTLVSKELWGALGPARYDAVVQIYLQGTETKKRAIVVFDYWNRVGRMVVANRVNRKRFIARFGGEVERAWRDYELLVQYFEQHNPNYVADFKALHEICAKERS